MKLSRRNLLGLGAVGLVGSGVPAVAHSIPRGARKERPAKNVIFVVVDGMAASVMTMVDHLHQMEKGTLGYWAGLMQEEYVVNGLQDTRSLSSLVTDSSAASGAWGSGRWQWNGQVNMFPDGTVLRPLTHILGDAGVRCGLVTTATITHATPAGFAVSCPSRSQEARIAELYLDANVDVLMGGGDAFFNPATRTDRKDLYELFRGRGFDVVRDRAGMLASTSGKVLGIYDTSHLPYTVDHLQSPALLDKVPTLAEMAQSAIDRLKGSPNGFVLQIEGAKVDHAGHANDLAGLIYDQIAFEEAMKVAVDFALEDGETLVIVTSDHATGGVALNGFGPEYGLSTPGLRKVLEMKASYTALMPLLREDPSAAHISDVVKDRLGLELQAEEAQAIAVSAGGQHPLALNQFMRSLNATAGAMIANHTGVGWTSTNHTSDHVLVTALGPGKEQLAGLTQNTAMFDIILGAKGLKWSNPKMTYEEARKHVRTQSQALARAVEEHTA
jgi:alkaline phosphatase